MDPDLISNMVNLFWVIIPHYDIGFISSKPLVLIFLRIAVSSINTVWLHKINIQQTDAHHVAPTVNFPNTERLRGIQLQAITSASGLWLYISSLTGLDSSSLITEYIVTECVLWAFISSLVCTDGFFKSS